MQTIRILLVDDQRAIRQALQMLLALEADMTVVGEADSGAEALRLIPLLEPDVVVMDVKMPGMDGMTCTSALRSAAPGTPVVILSLYDTAAARRHALEAGAAAFVSKHDAGDLLLGTIRHAAGMHSAG
jgi:DNA-binding NarL/FixJ family response regulator